MPSALAGGLVLDLMGFESLRGRASRAQVGAEGDELTRD